MMMTKYLLLRDNKESGPYSFDEIKIKGLKAYDLVWVEGRSAAWRYPGEVEELSSFAPAVEEQPFDRFFKKPSRENVPVTAPVQQTTIQQKQITQSSRTIYVTLPAGKGSPTPIPLWGSPSSPDRPSSPYEPIAAATAYNPQQNPLPLSQDIPYPEDKYSQVRENRSAHVEGLPQINKANKRRYPSKTLRPVAITLGVLALLAAGIFIGLSINKTGLSTNKTSPDIAQNTGAKKSPANPQPAFHAAGSLPASLVASAQPSPAAAAGTAKKVKKAAPSTLAGTGTTLGNPPKTAPVGIKSFPPSPKPLSVPPSAVKDSAGMNLNVPVVQASRQTGPPADKIDKEEAIRNNLSNLVSVGAGHYTVGTFGGISSVQLTVNNKSVHPLDLVVVAVQYILSNKKVFKTENLYFRGIGPGSALMLEAPNSPRGIKVQYKITFVHSKELGLSYSAL